MKMPIAKQRSIIDQLNWARGWHTGGTSEENARCNLPEALAPYVAAVEALDIPARFADDIERRSTALKHAANVIAQWQEKRKLLGMSQ